MKLNTKTIIQLLPLDEEMKQSLLTKWDDMDPDLRYEIENLVWEAYYELEDVKVQEQVQTDLQKVKAGELPLNQDFYAHAVEETEKDQGKEIHESADTVELASVRQRLELLMRPQQ